MPTDYTLIEKGLEKEFEHFEGLDSFSTGSNHYGILLQKVKPERLGENSTFRKPLRAVFSYLMYRNIEAVGGKFKDCCSKQFWTGQLPLVVEALMSILYYDNQILDQKAGVIGLKAIKKNLLIGGQLRAQLDLYIQKRIPAEIQPKLRRLVSEVTLVVNTGQFKEQACNFYQHWLNEEFEDYPASERAEKLAPHDLLAEIITLIHEVCPELKGKKELFLEKYLQRVYMVNGFFFERITRLIFELLVEPTEKEGFQDLIRFAQVFGIMHQLVNDTWDFVPSNMGYKTAAKDRRDAMRDFRNGNITLPTLIHLQRYPNGKVMDYLKKLHASLDTTNGKTLPSPGYSEKLIFHEVCKHFSVFYAMEITSEIQKNFAEKILVNLLKQGHLLKTWKDHLKIGSTNKFYKKFKAQVVWYKMFERRNGAALEK